MPDALRVDVLLHRLRITRSRSEAKAACDVGAVLVDGNAVRASHTVEPGQRIEVCFPHRLLEIELLESPGKSISKQAVRELYTVLRDEQVSGRTDV